MNGWLEFVASAKGAATVALATVASGVIQFIGLIPDEIGKLATLAGIALTVVMLKYWRVQTRNAKLDGDIKAERLRKMRAG